MTVNLRKLIPLFALLFITQVAKAQYPVWNDPNSLPIWMTAEEMTRKHEIGKGFLKSAAAIGPVRNISEFERMEGVLVRYPLGLPTSLIATMSQHTKVYTLVSTSTYETQARSAYQSAGANLSNCLFIRASTDSYWTRDYGPWYIVDQNNQVSIVDFPYNRPRANDDAVNGKVATYLGIPMYSMPVIHTGGNYMTDSWGISASTDLVLSENSSRGEAWVRQQMQDYLGVHTYHITIDPLGDYIKHIDCWGKFLDVDKVLITRVPTSNSNYSKYEQVASYFASQTSAYGTPYQVFRVYSPNGEPYTNSLILNDRVYVPTKNTSNDAAALAVYRQAMPGYTVTGIYYSSWASTDALHCRAIGMADRQMLYINHMPLAGTKDYQSTYEITADVLPLSGQALIMDSLRVFYKTNARTSYMPVNLTLVSGNKYRAYLPVNPGETQVSYFIRALDNSGRKESHPLIGYPDPHTFNVNLPTTRADFYASTTTTAVNQSITFTDASTGGPFSSWSWNFGQDAVPATANSQGPHVVYYTTPGSKTVSLTVDGTYTETKTNYITVIVPVTGVSVNPLTAALLKGQTLQLIATVVPSNATNKSVTWSSANTAIATVSTSGLVTATGGGSTIITVTTVDGGFIASSAISVTVSVTGVTVSPATASMDIGETLQLTAAVLPTDATNKNVTWSSSNEAIAQVSGTGLVTSSNLGSVVITATTEEGSFTANCSVSVISGGCTYVTINSQNFDSSWGIWLDGGTDCARSTSYPNSGRYCIRLRDNTSSSVMTTTNLNLTAYNELTVSFSYYPVSFDNSSEDFWLQISTNGGSTYTTVEEWNWGDEFLNNQRKSASAVISGPFTSTTRLRIRCDASADDDQVYIDDVRIDGCSTSLSAPDLIVLAESETVPGIKVQEMIDQDLPLVFNIYPNPTTGMINISAMGELDGPVTVSVISSTGQVLIRQRVALEPVFTLKIDNLATGYCIIRIETGKEVVYKKVLLVR